MSDPLTRIRALPTPAATFAVYFSCSTMRGSSQVPLDSTVPVRLTVTLSPFTVEDLNFRLDAASAFLSPDFPVGCGAVLQQGVQCRLDLVGECHRARFGGHQGVPATDLRPRECLRVIHRHVEHREFCRLGAGQCRWAGGCRRARGCRRGSDGLSLTVGAGLAGAVVAGGLDGGGAPGRRRRGGRAAAQGQAEQSGKQNGRMARGPVLERQVDLLGRDSWTPMATVGNRGGRSEARKGCALAYWRCRPGDVRGFPATPRRPRGECDGACRGTQRE